MPERGLPPYPLSDNWREWAQQIVEYLVNQARSEEFVAPRTLGLSHQLPNEVYRAVVDGLVMFDPDRSAPVFSENGDWVLFLHENSIFLSLSDTPSDYTGQAGKSVIVNSAEDAVIFSNAVLIATIDAAFPASPVSGLLHYKTGPTPGLHIYDGSNWLLINVNEDHDATGTASWRIIGMTLECWGLISVAGGSGSTSSATVNLPKTYANNDYVAHATAASGAGYNTLNDTGVNSRTTTQFDVVLRRSNSTNTNILWSTIGEWDGVS